MNFSVDHLPRDRRHQRHDPELPVHQQRLVRPDELANGLRVVRAQPGGEGQEARHLGPPRDPRDGRRSFCHQTRLV